MLEQHGEAIWVLRYETPEDLEPEKNRPHLEELKRALGTRRGALIFDVGPGVKKVDLRTVPAFWLNATAEPEFPVSAMAIVSRGIAVQIAARSFGLAARARSLPLTVQTFEQLSDALEWARSEVGSAAQMG